MDARIEFVVDSDNGTTSFLVNGVEMGLWINAQPPAWAKKLVQIIEQRERLAR